MFSYIVRKYNHRFSFPVIKCLVYDGYFHIVSDGLCVPLLLQRPTVESVRSALQLLTGSASRLAAECQRASRGPNGTSSTLDVQQLTQQVIQCSYDIAKAAKQLVTILQEPR